MSPCPHCEVWISPERDDLIGWDSAKSENEAADIGFWSCPNCGEKIGEEDRKASLLEAKLVHRGQAVDKQGRITGDPPDTSRLFFRATAFHNLFLSAGSIAKDEWRALQIPEDSPERFSADRELCSLCIASVCFADVCRGPGPRQESNRITRIELPQHVLPADTKWLTLGCDIGEKKLWYLLLATRIDAEWECVSPCASVRRHRCTKRSHETRSSVD